MKVRLKILAKVKASSIDGIDYKDIFADIYCDDDLDPTSYVFF